MKKLVERNVVVKNWRMVQVKVALVYPGGYRTGMTGLTVQLLYHLFNLRDDTLCERVFLEGSKQPRSLESGRTLREFDILAVPLQFEENYVKFLRGLVDSGIPLHRVKRLDKHPLVVAGGPCVMSNPTVLEDYVDVFAVGDAEALTDVLIDVYKEHGGRLGRLETLSELEGFYVPGFTENPVNRVWVESLDKTSHPVAQVIPLVDERSPLCPIFGLTFSVEATRGCGRLCRFCLGSWINQPARHRSLATMIELIEAGLRRTGVRKVSLIGMGVTDNRQLKTLCQWLSSMDVDFSIPSLRMDLLDEELMRFIAEGGQRTLTLAPEAASEDLRKLIGKPIPGDKLLKVAEEAHEVGFRRVKLYFMVGLPGECLKDLEAIGRLVGKISKIGFRQVYISVNPLIPKPQTPFQWLPLASKTHLNEAYRVLRRSLPRSSKIRVETLKPSHAEIQTLLSQGGSEVGKVLKYMVLHGSGKIKEACRRFEVDLNRFVYGAKDPDDPLPWSLIRSADLKILKSVFHRFESELSVIGDI